jgi:HK97 family phage major capsid protein
MSLSKKAILEIQELSSKAEALARGSTSQRKQADVLCQRISTIRQVGFSTDEARGLYCEALVEETNLGIRKSNDAEHRAKFDAYLAGQIQEREMRDFLAGTQSITYTQGAAGGYTVPLLYDETLRFALAQVDPILDEKVTSFSMATGATLQSEQISGYDLSSVSAQIVGESVQQNPQSIPPVLGAVLKNNIIFKATFAASWEAEQDIPDFGTKIVRAAGVALARRIGQSVLAGRGGADIAGVVQALGGATVSNATAGKIVNTDITKIFFSVDRFYRAAPKCGFLMNDAVYKLVRNATDAQGRPLVSISEGAEVLMGRPVYVSPSMATLYSSLGLVGSILFGDLASVVIRASRPQIERSIELAQVDITHGQAAWIARARCDAAFFDPSSGANPPLVLAAIS